MAVERGGRVQDHEGTGVDGGVTPVERVAGPFRDRAAPIHPSGSAVCPFLASESSPGQVGPAIVAVDPANRCVALGEPVPQSSRQQEFVCLTDAHVNCPRFLRGSMIGSPSPQAAAREPISSVVIAAALVLVAALAASFGFLAVRGGFDVALASAQPSRVAIASSPSPSPSPTLAATPSPSPVVTPSPSPSPSPTPTASPKATPAPPTPTPTPAPTSDRFALLTRCPSTTDCWIYVVRSGDNLRSIANYFGVSYDRVVDMNPNLGDPASIRPGFRLRIPTPTR